MIVLNAGTNANNENLEVFGFLDWAIRNNLESMFIFSSGSSISFSTKSAISSFKSMIFSSVSGSSSSSSSFSSFSCPSVGFDFLSCSSSSSISSSLSDSFSDSTFFTTLSILPPLLIGKAL